MLNHKISVGILTITLGLLYIQPLPAQLKGLKKKAAKVIKKSVKPLELEYKVTDVHYQLLKNPNKLKLDLEFTGKNPNAIGLTLSRIEFDVYVNDKFVAKLYNDKKIKIPKRGTFSFEEKAELKLSTFGKALFTAMTGEKATYRIMGTYFVKTKLGTFSFKVELLEKQVQLK